MKSRILVSVIGVPLILVVVLWAPIWVMAAFLAALSAIAAWELMQCVGARAHKALCAIAISGAAFSVGFAYFKVYIYSELVVLYALLVFSYAVFRGGEVKFPTPSPPSCGCPPPGSTGGSCCYRCCSALAAIPLPFLPGGPLAGTSWPRRSAPTRRWRGPLAAWLAMRWSGWPSRLS